MTPCRGALKKAPLDGVAPFRSPLSLPCYAPQEKSWALTTAHAKKRQVWRWSYYREPNTLNESIIIFQETKCEFVYFCIRW